MSGEHIQYRAGYKFQLAADYQVTLPWGPPAPIHTEYIDFASDPVANGLLRVKEGYAWDGPSDPILLLIHGAASTGQSADIKPFLRASLVHDALYQLMRERQLDHERYREMADRTLRDLCIEDGMHRLRADLVYEGVHVGGAPSADPKNAKPIYTAP